MSSQISQQLPAIAVVAAGQVGLLETDSSLSVDQLLTNAHGLQSVRFLGIEAQVSFFQVREHRQVGVQRRRQLRRNVGVPAGDGQVLSEAVNGSQGLTDPVVVL